MFLCTLRVLSSLQFEAPMQYCTYRPLPNTLVLLSSALYNHRAVPFGLEVNSKSSRIPTTVPQPLNLLLNGS